MNFDPSPQGAGDDVVDDMKAEARRPLSTSRGDERIEDSLAHVWRDPLPVVAKNDPHAAFFVGQNVNRHAALLPPGKAVGVGVRQEIGQHLGQGARIAVEFEIARAADFHPMSALASQRAQGS